MSAMTDAWRCRGPNGITHLLNLLHRATPEQIREVIADLPPAAIERLKYDWRLWARPEQLEPGSPGALPPLNWKGEPAAGFLVWLYLAGRGAGKLLDPATPVPVPSGWATMGALRVGDVVFDESGRQCSVTAVFDSVPERAFRIWFADGSHVDAGGEHQWVTWTHRDRKAFSRSRWKDCADGLPDEWPTWRALSQSRWGETPTAKDGAPGPRVRTTDEIVATLLHGGRGDRNHSIPVCGALQTDDAVLPVDPWALGYWLGNGARGVGVITMHRDDENFVRREMQYAGYVCSESRPGDRAPTFSVYKLIHDLRAAGVLENKHVPAIYLRASIVQRRALLAGLIDSDGYVEPGTGNVEFCSTDLPLVTAVLELVRSLGEKPYFVEGRATLYGKDCGPSYRVGWRAVAQPFRSPRKASAWEPIGRRAIGVRHRMITSVESIEVKPMRCITVDSRHSTYLVGEAMIPTHNTRGGAEWAIEQARAHPDEHGALVAATMNDVRKTMLSEGKESVGGESGIMAVSPPDFRPVYEQSRFRLRWPNGAVATCYSAEEPDRLRGPQHGWAWCFVAGTMILTPTGEVPIENLRIGDLVMTRVGARRISAVGVRGSTVGKVGFSHGRFLVGTAEHPVLETHGWTNLADLSIGSNVLTVTNTLTSARRALTTATNDVRSFGIGGSGNKRTGQFQRVDRFTTSTVIRLTTALKTLFASLPPNIGEHIRTLVVDGLTRLGDLSPVVGVTRSLLASSAMTACAFVVNSVQPINDARASAFVASVDVSSCHAPETTVISVVSTWEPIGRADVHNITVEGEPEFFANGVLVHNCDEQSSWRYPEAWDMLLFGMRVGHRPRVLVTTTPKPKPLIKMLVSDPSVAITRGRTLDNLDNLAPTFIDQITRKYAGTRLGRQELEGELLEDVEGALWRYAWIENKRVEAVGVRLKRTVVAIDPQASDGTGRTDQPRKPETGIVVASIGMCPCLDPAKPELHGFVTHDLSGSFSPGEWGKIACDAYKNIRADRIVGEKNNGGAMVEHTIRTVNKHAAYTAVWASKGKQARAEPVAALYEQGRIHHVGEFRELEDQLCSWEAMSNDPSPNRLDALVWAIHELMLEDSETTAEKWARM